MRAEHGPARPPCTQDITAVITFLPFLEDWGGDYTPDGEEESEIYINKGTPGLARIKGSGSSESVATPAKDTAGAPALP